MAHIICFQITVLGFSSSEILSVLCLVTQLCPTLCHPRDCSPPGSSVQGTLQARILEWVATPSSRGSSQPRDQTQVSHIAGRLFTIWDTREALVLMQTRLKSDGLNEIVRKMRKKGREWKELTSFKFWMTILKNYNITRLASMTAWEILVQMVPHIFFYSLKQGYRHIAT